MFITFEGGEGAGKSTLISSLSKYLTDQGRRVLVTREPGGTDVGEAIRQLLLNSGDHPAPKTELLLFLASRVEHLQKVIEPALSKGEIVLCDRYNDSSIAYQGVARNLGFEFVESLCSLAAPLVPNLTFYLDIAPEKAMERIQRSHDRIESETQSFHEKVRMGFLQIAAKYPNRMIVIDASQSKEAVFNEVKKHVF